MSHYYAISGYWKDDGEFFDDYVVKEFDDANEDDDDVFYFGMSEADIIVAIELGEDSDEEFVITDYEILA